MEKHIRIKICFIVLLIICIFGFSFSYAQNKETILRIHGSNTIGSKLAPDLAEEFLVKLGASKTKRVEIIKNTEVNIEGTFTQQNVVKIIEIKAHGSSTGFKSLQSGQCDIGMASRQIKDLEEKNLSFLGNMKSIACEHVLAVDGVAIIVNLSNYSISKMDIKNVREIFCCQKTNWKEVDINASDKIIQVLARDKESGTHDCFKSIVLAKKCKLCENSKRFDSNDALSNIVQQNPNAIGYCGLPYVKNNKVLAISDHGPPIRPTVFTIATEDYPLTRRLYFYTPANPNNIYTHNFISFALGKEGQKLVKKNKFIPLTISATEYEVEISQQPQNKQIFTKYLSSVKGAKRLSTNFRFKTAKFDLDTRAIRDMDRMVEFLNEEDIHNTKILLAGFADSRGDYWKNYELSCNRAKTVKDEFRSRGIKVHTIICVSEESPVATNETKAGQSKNRRVEVWIK